MNVVRMELLRTGKKEPSGMDGSVLLKRKQTAVMLVRGVSHITLTTVFFGKYCQTLFYRGNEL